MSSFNAKVSWENDFVQFSEEDETFLRGAFRLHVVHGADVGREQLTGGRRA